ncbi:MAG: ABC transporter permease [Opitutaceae bacterium]
MPWYLYLALKQLFSTGQRVFFTAISVVSVALGVALLIIVLSVMGGFGYKIHQMIVDTQGDVQVRAATAIEDAAAVQRVIRKVPGVVATTPFAQGFVMIQYEGKPEFPTVQGIDPGTVAAVTPLDPYIAGGSLDDLDDDSVILSSILAESIGAGIGSMVEIYSPAILSELGSGEIMLPKQLKVVGIFEIGHQQLDSSTVIVTLRTMQELYGLGSAVHGINIKIWNGLDADRESARINDALARADGTRFPFVPGLEAHSWRELNQNFLWALRMEKSTMTVILLFVILVAAFLTMSLLIVLVLKKTREIGLFAALGATRLQVGLCFCLQGVGIGIVGAGLGTAIGFTVLRYREELIQIVTRLTGGQEALVAIYQFTEIPAHTSRGDLTLILVAAVVMSTLAGAIPACIAARLNPVEALRNE